jgi:hypothetical protein
MTEIDEKRDGYSYWLEALNYIVENGFAKSNLDVAWMKEGTLECALDFIHEKGLLHEFIKTKSDFVIKETARLKAENERLEKEQ